MERVSVATVIPVRYLRECFEHDAASGTLKWRVDRPRSHFVRPAGEASYRNRFAGKVAGRIGTNQYRIVTLSYGGRPRKLQVHRVLWALHHGAWPTQVIDHINRVKLDNKIENLRDVSQLVNSRNRADRPGAASGEPNVRRRGNRFYAYIGGGGKQIYLGSFSTTTEARAAVAAARSAA